VGISLVGLGLVLVEETMISKEQMLKVKLKMVFEEKNILVEAHKLVVKVVLGME